MAIDPAVASLVTMVIGALVEMGVEAAANQVTRRESAIRILKRVGLDADQPPADFNGAYLHALVDFGIGKPEPMLDIFRDETIREAFQRAFENDDMASVVDELRDLLDWHEVGNEFKKLDIDPAHLVEQFAASFQSVVDRTRTVFEVRLEHKLDDFRSTQQAVPEKLDEILRRLPVQNAVAFDDQSEKVIAEKVYDARIEQARDLVNRHKPKTAWNILKEIEREIESKQVSSGLNYRLVTAITHSLVHLGRDAEAAQYLIDGLRLDPASPKSIANASLGYLLQGDLVTAKAFASRAYTLDESQTTALSVMLQAHHGLNTFEEIDEALIGQAENDLDTRRTLAIVRAERGDLEEAERLHRITLASEVIDTQDKALLGQVLI